MGMIKEFKDFAMKGNLVDIAVGFVMGAAFNKVVSSFIDGIVMPGIGMLTSGIDFNQIKYVLKEGTPAITDGTGAIVSAEVAEVAMTYGAFITTVINFIVVAFVVFMLIKAINNAKKAEPAPPPPGPSNEEKLLTEIRDSLKK